LALLAYVICVGACIYVLLPHELVTEVRGSVLLNTSREVKATDDEVFETAVTWLEDVRAKKVPLRGRARVRQHSGSVTPR
jgi:hypothetical protein